MKIIKQEKKGSKVRIEIEEDYSRLKAMIDRSFAEAAKGITVPGFRKGNAPRNVVEKYVNENAVIDRAVQNLVSDTYPDIIKQAGIEPVYYPNVVVDKREEGSPFLYTVEVEVYPEVKLGKYKGVKAEKESEDVSDKEVEDFVEGLRQRTARIVEVSGRGAGDGDIVEVDVNASVEGADVKTLSGKRMGFEIGQARISKEFDSELIGLKAGDSKEFRIAMPEEHPARDVAGKTVSFSVKAAKVSARELDDLNDDFAKRISGKATLQELKDDVRKSLSSSKKQTAESEVKNRLVEEISKGISADIPEGMMERETDVMLDEMRGSLARSKLTLDDYLKMTKKSEKDVRSELRNGAVARVRSKLALRAVAEAEKLEVTPEEMDEELSRLAGSSGQPGEKFKSSVGESGLEYIKDYMLRRKALDFVLSKAKLVEKKKGRD